MKKLTAEIARRDISHLKAFQKQPNIGLSLREETYLQALEIALPILEQQERGGDGWIEWEGGECPVPRGTIVDVRYRSGQVEKSACAWGWGSCPGTSEASSAAGAAFWENDSIENDIIAYRIIPERANKATLTDEKREWLIDECKADMQRYTLNSPRYLVAQIALASLEACCIIPEQPTNQSGEQ